MPRGLPHQGRWGSSETDSLAGVDGMSSVVTWNVVAECAGRMDPPARFYSRRREDAGPLRQAGRPHGPCMEAWGERDFGRAARNGARGLVLSGDRGTRLAFVGAA